ncbi:MAG: aminopeptidase P family protein [Candidatus Woesearchaeota archaeon]|nr:MAG: aminopeptidase P family protein [Candidatus Woesearchaeota archaeon]
MNKYKSIKRACEINDVIFNEIVNNFDFKTEKDIERYIKKRFKDFKVKQGYSPIVANNNVIIHPKPRNKGLKRGFLLLDFGSKYNDYCSDMTRTIFIGKANNYERKLYNLILNCQKKCLKKIKLGIPYCDLEIYSRILLKEYKPYFKHSLGHGVDKKVHANPRVSLLSKDKAIKGDVITIEPGIYFEHKGKQIGIRIEDTIYVGNKIEVLCNSSKRLIEVQLKHKG